MNKDPHRPIRIAWILLIGAGVAVYANSLSGPFIFDDKQAIVQNSALRHLWPPRWLTQAWTPQQSIHARVVTSFSLAVNYALGGTDVRGYHILNIAIHILCALVLFGVVRRTLQSKHLVQPYGRSSTGLALVIAVIWLVHPLQTECVNYILQRSESIMGLFYLTALYCAIQAFQKNQVRFWAIASVVCCALGMASKEVMVSAPVIILLYDRVFYGDTLRQIFRRRWRLYAGLALTWFILAALLWNRPHQNTIGFSSNIGPWDYAKNQCLMVVTYLRLSIWPHPLILDYGFPIPDLSVTEVAPYAALLLVLISLTIIALRHNPRLGFLGVWVFFILVPTSSFVPILTEVGTERRMYLPLVAPVVFLTILGFEILQRLGSKTNFGVPLPKHRARIAGLFILGIVIVLGCVTVRRNQDYSTKFSIWQTVLDSRPQSPRALNNLGFVLFDESRFEGAIPYFQKALKLKPNFVTAYYNLARALTEAGRPDEALPHYETAFRLDSDASHVQQSMITMLNDLGRAFLVQDQRHKAILHFQKALELQPDYIIARNNLGIAFLRSKRYQEAIDQFQQILKLNPEITGVLNNTTRNNLGVAFLQSKHYQEAIDQFQQILKLNPENTGALDNLDLAIQLQKEGQNPYKRSMR